MMEEQHRMVTWFESMFMPFPELIVSLVIFIEIFGGIGIILGGLIGLFANQAGSDANESELESSNENTGRGWRLSYRNTRHE